jgi:hypothetical protein
MCGDSEIEKVLLNNKVKGFLYKIGLQRYEIWDEGLGWLAFRFIRPGVGDGYPLSRKAWGPAKNVVSCWVPIIGYEPMKNISHLMVNLLKESTV